MDLGPTRTDHALAAAIAAGDEHAFELLAHRHRPRLLRFAAGRLGERRDEAEDVVQDALIRAYRALRGGKVPEHTSAWLHTIVANCCADRHSAAARRPTVSLHEEGVPVETLPGAAELDPHAAAVRRAEVERTVDAIAALPEAQRRAFVGFELEGRSYADLGERHGWSLAATKSLIWRARGTLAGTRASWGASLPFTQWTDRLAAFLPHGGEALACVGVAAALTAAPQLPDKVLPDRDPEPKVAQAAQVARVASAATPARHRGTDAAGGSGTIRPSTPGEVLRACADGRSIDGAPAGVLSRARGEMSVDQAEYSRCSSAIDAALIRGQQP